VLVVFQRRIDAFGELAGAGDGSAFLTILRSAGARGWGGTAVATAWSTTGLLHSWGFVSPVGDATVVEEGTAATVGADVADPGVGGVVAGLAQPVKISPQAATSSREYPTIRGDEPSCRGRPFRCS